MNVRSLLAGLVVLGYVGFEVNAVRMSQHLFEPLFTFDQFASMHHATASCPVADRGLAENFALNFAAVRVQAARDLAEAQPETSPDDIERLVSEREVERAREVQERIAAGGCDDPEIWKWRKLYEQRARLRIRASS